MKIIFASQNPNKLNEIQSQLANYDVVGLDPLLFPEELQETGATIDANARQKAQQVWDKTHESCFADDTGLEVKVLGGMPGVISKRFAGPNANSDENIDKLLDMLHSQLDRSAQFKTVISLSKNGKIRTFEGICKGNIALKRIGNQGFGYDPIFIPENKQKSFGQMSLNEKNLIAHRAKAVKKLIEYLTNLY